MSFLKLANDLLARGFSVIPLKSGEKAPMYGVTSRTKKPEIVATWAEEFPDANVGFCADDRTVILDADDAAALMKETGPIETFTVESSAGKAHYYFRRDGFAVRNLELGKLGSLRAENMYVVGAGSIHPKTGHPYRIINDAPVATLDQGLFWRLESLAEKAERDVARITADWDGRSKIREGMRHYFLRSRAGKLWDGEKTEEQLFAELQDLNQKFCDPPKSEGDISRLVEWVVRKEPNRVRVVATLGPERSPVGSWLCDADQFLARELQPRKALLTDAETGGTLLYEKSLNQIFAFRGVGKSVVANGLLGCLVRGEQFLKFKSPGGLRCLLVDAELPAVQLQERLREFSGVSQGKLKIISPELMLNPKEFPALSQIADQKLFLHHVESFAPQVVIFDTLTRCFRFDTNDADAWLVVNDFLIDLRSRGICVILVHHGGKNGTQRGRTDGDDNLDLSVKLELPYGYLPGDGLAFKWTYEKVRHGAKLLDFEASYENGSWQISEDQRAAEVLELSRAGKTQRQIAAQLDTSQATVNRILRRAKSQRLDSLNRLIQ